MPKGEYTRPRGESRKKLADPSGKSDEHQRRAAASGKAKNYTSAPISDKQFQKEMRERERVKPKSEWKRNSRQKDDF